MFYPINYYLTRLKLIIKNKIHSNNVNSLPNLKSDRNLEWTYIATRIGYYANKESKILDFGCGDGFLSYGAASLGSHVVAIDLMPRLFDIEYPNIEFRQMDVMSFDESHENFDIILNCSTIEHVGLIGRYNSIENQKGDLIAMEKLRRLLKPEGVMLLTIPVGQDAVISPLHRIYGVQRLPSLLEGYRVLESMYWRKDMRNIWLSCNQNEALVEKGNDHYYAIGCMVLQKS